MALNRKRPPKKQFKIFQRICADLRKSNEQNCIENFKALTRNRPPKNNLTFQRIYADLRKSNEQNCIENYKALTRNRPPTKQFKTFQWIFADLRKHHEKCCIKTLNWHWSVIALRKNNSKYFSWFKLISEKATNKIALKTISTDA